MQIIRRYYRQTAGFFIISIIIVSAFQNCGPTGFDVELEQAESYSSISDANELSSPTDSSHMTSPNLRQLVPSPAPDSVSAPVVKTPPDAPPTSSEDCQSELAVVEWDSPAKFKNIKITKTYRNGGLVGQQTLPSSNGFTLSFFGDKPATDKTFKQSPDIPSGFGIKFTNLNTNSSFDIAPGDFIPAYDSNSFIIVGSGALSNTTSSHTTKYNRVAVHKFAPPLDTRPGFTVLNFFLTRDIYDRNSGLGNVKVELFCKGSLVVSSVVNFASVENSVVFKSYYEKTEFSSTYSWTTPSGKKVYYFEKPFDGWIQPFCPPTAKPGEKVTCTIQKDKITSFIWSHLPDRTGHDARLNDNPEVSFIAPAAGSRYVGVKGTTTDGRTVYGSLYIKVN